jgi:glutamyl-tRNA reductase
MSVLLLGLSHKTAPVEVRERFAFANGQTERLMGRLLEQPGIEEALVLSTCNRVEFLVQADVDADPTEGIFSFLTAEGRTELEQVKPFFYRYTDRDAVRHLFRVASSLDSMVLGEPQILPRCASTSSPT